LTGYERVKLGVGILDELIPEGVPQRSFVLLTGEGGAGKSLLVTMIASSFISRGEPVVYLALDDDPSSIASALASRGVELGQAVTEGLLVLIDGYGARFGLEPDPVAVERIASLEPREVQRVLRRVFEERGIEGRGLLVIDSINPFFLSYEPTMVYDLIGSIRAAITKRKSILTLATIHTTGAMFEEISDNLEYMVDAVVYTRSHVKALEAGYPIRQLLVKKAKGACIEQGWVSYMITDEGLVEVEVKEEPESKGG
jgi:KaiC/GvpD/RAD55 family RecA-like ATPase